MQATMKEFQALISKELHMPKVEVLQAITPIAMPKAGRRWYFVQFIDGAEEEDQKSAIADSPNPKAMKNAYQASPTYIYARVEQLAGGKWTAKLMSKDEISKIKNQGDSKAMSYQKVF